VVWYALSFVESNVGSNLYLHYYLLIVPPLSLLAAWFLAQSYHYLKTRARIISQALPVALLIAILITSAEQNFDFIASTFDTNSDLIPIRFSRCMDGPCLNHN